MRGSAYSRFALVLSALRRPSAARYVVSDSRLKLELNGKLIAAPIGVDPLESRETNGVTSIAGDVALRGAAAPVPSCAPAGAAETAQANATMVRVVTAFMCELSSRCQFQQRTLRRPTRRKSLITSPFRFSEFS
jgi:hypothetical protein